MPAIISGAKYLSSSLNVYLTSYESLSKQKARSKPVIFTPTIGLSLPGAAFLPFLIRIFSIRKSLWIIFLWCIVQTVMAILCIKEITPLISRKVFFRPRRYFSSDFAFMAVNMYLLPSSSVNKSIRLSTWVRSKHF